jgi:hypothetical protein
MKKNYNIPATEVVAFVGGFIMQSGSGAGPTPGPTPGLIPDDPNGANTIGGGDA